MNLQESLKHKVGGLPVGLWIVGVGGGLIIAVYVRRAYSSSDGDAGAAIDGAAYTASDPVTDGTGSAAVSDPSYYGTGGSQAGSSTSAGTTAAGITTNLQWKRAVVAAAPSMGYSSLWMQRVVDRYFSGKSLSQAAAKALNKAIAQFGMPPSGVPTPVVTPAAATPAPPAHANEPKTNAAWQYRAVHDAVVRGGYSVTVTRTAIKRYLAGQSLTQAQQTIRDRAIARHGTPPKPPHHASATGAAVKPGEGSAMTGLRVDGSNMPGTDTTRTAAVAHVVAPVQAPVQAAQAPTTITGKVKP